jgi:CRISPR/Cas system-associated endonuclease Cas3-HD
LYHHLDVWEHSLLALSLFESNPIPTSLEVYLDRINDYISERISGYERLVWLKFALLLHDVGKPITKGLNDRGQISFFKHEVEGSKLTVQIANRFKLSSKSKEILETLVRNHLRTMHLSSPQTTKKAIYRFIKDCKGEWLGVLLISHADLCASRGLLRTYDDISKNHKLMITIADIYFKEILPAQQAPKLISGDDLIREFNLQPGPLIGKILTKIEEARIEGNVKSKDEAMNFARELLAK